MKKDTKFKPGQSGNPETRFKPGNQHRWPPRQSGNPAGIARSRLQFEESFYAALLDRGSAEEVASRLAPESKQIKMTHGLQNETNIDYTRLSGAELDQIQRLLERARVPTGTGEDGESAPRPEGIRD